RGEEPALDEALLVVVVVVVDGDGCGIGGHGTLPLGSFDQPAAGAAAAEVVSAATGAALAFSAASHCSYSATGSARTTIGMKPWSLPHSSAHWPRYTPGTLISVQASLTMPGTASCFQPSAGTHQEWMTSSAVITKRILVSTGT